MSNSTDTDKMMDYTLAHAHGTVMVIAWMIFASTGILFARYGRTLHIGERTKILGEIVWFQVHRFALCTAALSTLVGFFLILAQAEGQWVDVNAGSLFAHSILGMIIVCCSQIQVWMALFRCHPNTRYRFIFNWMHRLTGLLAFTLSIPTIFLITFVLPNYRNGLVTILSLWSAWVVIIVIILEIIEYFSRKRSRSSIGKQGKYEVSDADSSSNDNSNIQSYNTIKLVLFSIHVIIALCLAISLIVLIWL
jgi:hypothetical protein